MESDDIKKLREDGRRRGDEIVSAQDQATLEDWRRRIEMGWQQAQRGEMVDGPETLARLRERLALRKPKA